MYAGLQELGVANGEDLKETLTNCTEPLKAIEQFQVGRVATETAGRGGPGGVRALFWGERAAGGACALLRALLAPFLIIIFLAAFADRLCPPFVLADRKWGPAALAAVGPALPGPARHPPAGVPPVGVRRAEGETAGANLSHRLGREGGGKVCRLVGYVGWEGDLM